MESVNTKFSQIQIGRDMVGQCSQVNFLLKRIIHTKALNFIPGQVRHSYVSCPYLGDIAKHQIDMFLTYQPT